jgi:uncharacterized protein (DUF2062 family)
VAMGLKYKNFKLPDKNDLKNNRFFKKHYHHIENRQYLWKTDKKSIANGVAIGTFSSLLPMPFQMFLATPLCIFFKGNLPISISIVWISNPITMPFIMVGQYLIGQWILGDKVGIPDDLSIMEIISNSFTPLLVGSIITAVMMACLGYFGVRLFYKKP